MWRASRPDYECWLALNGCGRLRADAEQTSYVVRLVLDRSMRFSEHCVLIHAANSCANDTRNLKLLDLNCDCRYRRRSGGTGCETRHLCVLHHVLVGRVWKCSNACSA